MAAVSPNASTILLVRVHVGNWLSDIQHTKYIEECSGQLHVRDYFA